MTIVVANPRIPQSICRATCRTLRTINGGGRARPGRSGIWNHHAD